MFNIINDSELLLSIDLNQNDNVILLIKVFEF
jgi:hypothetical protein